MDAVFSIKPSLPLFVIQCVLYAELSEGLQDCKFANHTYSASRENIIDTIKEITAYHLSYIVFVVYRSRQLIVDPSKKFYGEFT